MDLLNTAKELLKLASGSYVHWYMLLDWEEEEEKDTFFPSDYSEL